MKRKLTDRQCQQIRKEYVQALIDGMRFGSYKKSALPKMARKYGISRSHVVNVGRGVYR